MSTTYHKFLIVFAVMILIGGTYVYFSNGLLSEAATPVASNSSVSSSGGVVSSVAGPAIDDKIARDTAFLATLTSLTKIRIDTTLFMNSGFVSLRDNTVKIVNDGIIGRTNPFAPIVGVVDTTTVQALPVTTGEVTQITDKTAVLNGSTTLTGVTSSYFEYGTTPTLGKSTTPGAQSLVSTFTTKISGLTSKTKYFFRAVVKLNGQVMYGDITSFDTN